MPYAWSTNMTAVFNRFLLYQQTRLHSNSIPRSCLHHFQIKKYFPFVNFCHRNFSHVQRLSIQHRSYRQLACSSLLQNVQHQRDDSLSKNHYVKSLSCSRSRSAYFQPSREASIGQKGPTDEEKEILANQMQVRLLNENGFLSWCRNAILSTAMGIAILSTGTTSLTQSAGGMALTVGVMNLFWGTSMHITNLVRLRHVTGMSGFLLTLNIVGATVHCCLWLLMLVFYISFLASEEDEEGEGEVKGVDV